MHMARPDAHAMTSQQCIDDKTDEAMQRSALEGTAALHCERGPLTKIPGGFESSSVCKTSHGTVSSKMRVIGDMQSAYHIEVASHRDPPVGGMADTQTTMEAKWLGACPADMKPGDMRVNGMTMHLGAGLGGMPGMGGPGAAGMGAGMSGIDPKALSSMSPAERMEYMKKLMEARSQQQPTPQQ
jgi:hypothetical protein